MNNKKSINESLLSRKTLDWLADAKHQDQNLNFSLITQACQFVEQLAKQPLQTQQEQKPDTSTTTSSSLSLGLAIADELVLLNCDSTTLAAAILYPAFHAKQTSLKSIKEQFGNLIAKLITGVDRMAAIQSLSQDTKAATNPEQQADNLRKMLLTMVDDVRTVLIKLAERLTRLKQLRKATKAEQRSLAQQTKTLYAPLANRLGIGQIKWQLEDFAFRYLHTDTYSSLSKQLNMRRVDRESYVNQFINTLSQLLSNAKVNNIDISGRAKHIYSIYRKLQRKQVELSEIYDTTAVRVLVSTIKDCYTVLSIVHETWAHINEEFDDYIAKPKPNGYRSIHTVVIGPEKHNVEIQIRTYEMHEESELGVAAHWKYKEGKTTGQSSYEEKINWLRNVMDWQQEVSEAEQETLFEKIFADRIYVFTPHGDVYDLAANATPLDFAYHIHSDIGNQCRGAKVNGKLVPLTTHLKTGDNVDILTAKNHQPSRDWLNPHAGYLTSSRAKQKVRSYFRKLDQEKNYDLGLNLWDKAARREHLPKNSLEQVFQALNLNSVRDVIIAIGAGDLTTAAVINRLKQIQPAATAVLHEPEIKESQPSAPNSFSGESNFTIEGVGNLLTQLARCCRPIPGDAIIGYITQGRGISIHKQTCHNIKHSLGHNPERIIEVNWGTKTSSYPVNFVLETDNRDGLIRDITAVLANNNIALLGINSRVNPIKAQAHINFTIEIRNVSSLSKITNQLQSIAGVVTVRRV